MPDDKSGIRIINNTPKKAIIIPNKTFNFGFSLRKIIDKINNKIGLEEAITGALILTVLCKPKKKKKILTNTPKKAEPIIILTQSPWVILVSSLHFIKGINNRLAPKNLMKAKVNGGIFSSANLKTGEAAPQIKLAIIRASIGFIFKTINTD